MWNAGTIPFVLVAIVVATGPVIFMTHHSIRNGHLASLPDHARVPVPEDPAKFGWTVCPDCKAVVTDHSGHFDSVHDLALT